MIEKSAVGGIYEIRHKSSGKVYVGSAMSFKKRFATHLCQLKAGKHHSKKLQNAWNKYGEAEFEFRIIEIVADSKNIIPREQFWLDATNCAGSDGFNIRPTAGSPLGTKMSATSREKIRRAKLGTVVSKETRLKLSNANRGRVCSQETRAKISQKKTGVPASTASVDAMRIARLGATTSDQTKQKQRIARLGKINSPETIQKMKRKKSPESIAKREATKKANRLAAQVS